MKPLLLTVALAAALATPVAGARTLGSLEFTPCELTQPGTGATTRAECATLEVPEDPTRPEGRKIKLKVALAASRAAEPAADPLVFFAGLPTEDKVLLKRLGLETRVPNAGALLSGAY